MAAAAPDRGLVLQWNFDEGAGQIARDTGGNGLHGRIVGALFRPRGDGFALEFDGAGRVEGEPGGVLAALGKPGTSYSLEVWFKSRGKFDQSITERWPSGSGYPWAIRGPYPDGAVTFALYDAVSQANPVVRMGGVSNKDGTWHHLVAVRDASTDRLLLYVDAGLLGTARDDLRDVDVSNAGPFCLGARSAAPDDQERFGFRGQLDSLNLYDRALTPDEVVARYRKTAGGFGIDTTWFTRLRLTTYLYSDPNRVVAALDYDGLRPLPEDAVIRVELLQESATAVQTARVDPTGATGISEAAFQLDGLPRGAYRIRAAISPEGVCPAESSEFMHPASPESPVPPATRLAPPLPLPAQPPRLKLRVWEGGGIEVGCGGERFLIESRFSYPHGGYNVLPADEGPTPEGEQSWRVELRQGGDTDFSLTGRGDHYALTRRVRAHTHHVRIEDTITNTSNNDLGILVRHGVDAAGNRFERHLVAGFEGMPRREGTACPSVFVSRGGVGLAMAPVDDVFVVQSVLEASPTAAVIGTERFALPAGESYTLEWAVYVNTTADYYDFVNAFRRDEERISTIDGGFGWISKAPRNRRQVPSVEDVKLRNIKYACIHCLSGVADDPELSVEGIEVANYPEEMRLLREQIGETHRKFPDLKVFFHVAHSLYLTKDPDRFGDSKVIGPDGTQPVWEDPHYGYISKRRQEEGWRWYIYYPTPGNSFHDAMLESVDVMMDEIGTDGAFMDGFMWGYRGRWTYDRWDGRSAEIDPDTKTIKRRMASVLLLSQPSLVQFARKIRDKGGVVVANNSVITRTIAREKYIIHDREVHSGPYLHLAPSCTALADPRKIRSERELYLDVLDKLSWGMLFFYYEEGNVTYESLPARMFPMTFEEIRPGLVRGPERIVTMRSGVYGWPSGRDVHFVHQYDDRGGKTRRDCVTTADREGVRTSLELQENESAVVERIPVALECETPVNLLVRQYDAQAIEVALNGRGTARVAVRNGEFAVAPGGSYLLRTAGRAEERATADRNGVLGHSLVLDGPLTWRMVPSSSGVAP